MARFGGCAVWVRTRLAFPGAQPRVRVAGRAIFAFYPIFMGGAVVSLFMRYRKAGTIERLN